ncbi:dihydrofolate reductase family protein [Microlunatus sagamiharensis]|uniref:dihydrofolate reductase family protein n=1 Tax=Microlunatus sagamiharensis TaxID=546874 RepID=UPI0018D48D51
MLRAERGGARASGRGVDERVHGRLHEGPGRPVRLVGPRPRGLRPGHRGGPRALGAPARTPPVRDDALLGGPGGHRHARRGRARVREDLERAAEDRLLPHAHRRGGQLPPGRGRAGRGGRAAACRAGEGDIAVGGPTLAADAAALGLVEEYRTRVHPVLVGGGSPLFPQAGRRTDLELLESRPVGAGGVLYLRHRVRPGG